MATQIFSRTSRCPVQMTRSRWFLAQHKWPHNMNLYAMPLLTDYRNNDCWWYSFKDGLAQLGLVRLQQAGGGLGERLEKKSQGTVRAISQPALLYNGFREKDQFAKYSRAADFTIISISGYWLFGIPVWFLLMPVWLFVDAYPTV